MLAKNQFAASQIALLITFLPAFLLSGFLFSIDQMPMALQWITRILAGALLRLSAQEDLSQRHADGACFPPT